ncbi:MAG: twin-arginine translocation signal domain-containing protein, partial [Actinobacteria bacterium]|nr:twin-arginine translocation signal domain-containing protein [Actinomycetota bacterium]NIS28888.1 twin-arginine translocation signal domain-containing protein [Actinomycetota bacterium]NIV85641.1 twin-arginine translocation signal domain-containing protein [Actinomycetota bacterium]NIW26140.1 twin-arginine translocation signal domain-containing protein [Actinomycetota bacterium]NIX18710.1 twin-arginine translocation signal domain-containing protein [Actinomycetota bacterium]
MGTSRKDFLKLSAAAGGALGLGVTPSGLLADAPSTRRPQVREAPRKI